MPYFYTDETRESDPGALPDVEVFHGTACEEGGCGWYDLASCGADDHVNGYFYAFGFPGCLWDSDPVGPFDTEAEALADARKGVES